MQAEPVYNYVLVISDTGYISTGGAGAVSDWRCKLSDWMWEEAGEGPGHQDSLPHPSVQEVNISIDSKHWLLKC